MHFRTRTCISELLPRMGARFARCFGSNVESSQQRSQDRQFSQVRCIVSRKFVLLRVLLKAEQGDRKAKRESFNTRISGVKTKDVHVIITRNSTHRHVDARPTALEAVCETAQDTPAYPVSGAAWSLHSVSVVPSVISQYMFHR